jgi:hypothetical protein
MPRQPSSNRKTFDRDDPEARTLRRYSVALSATTSDCARHIDAPSGRKSCTAASSTQNTTSHCAVSGLNG